MKFHSLSLLLVLACVSPLSQAAEETKNDAQTTNLNDIADNVQASFQYGDANNAQVPLAMGSMTTGDAHDSPRHRQEKAHLMKRMDSKHGKWSATHPRYRLLEALFGFTKYRERNMAELERWRNLYKNVGKKQKKVRCSHD